MKLKYYLRGIGIGMLVTAAVLHFTFAQAGQKRVMTDDEVRIRALELGMIENTVLRSNEDTVSEDSASANVVAVTTPASVSTNSPVQSVSGQDVAIMDGGNVITDTLSTNGEAAPDDEDRDGTISSPSNNTENSNETEEINHNEAQDEDVVSGATEYKIITIASGDGSYAVARKAAEAGLVESAASFDQYLCENDFDKRLTTGSHRIPIGASEAEIARILTSRPE